MKKMFVANLPNFVNEDVLRQLFEATGGAVTEVIIPVDHATGWARGFAIITMASDKQAEIACQRLDNSFQGGRAISVRPFHDTPQRKTTPGPVSRRVVVRQADIQRVSDLLRIADTEGTLRPGQWLGINGFFWWSGPASHKMSQLETEIGGEPVGEGESFADAKSRLK